MDDSYMKLLELYHRRGFAGRVGFGARPAILVVDFIIAFTDPSSPLGSDLDKPLSETVRLLEAARGVGIPVLFTTVEYSRGLEDAGLFPKKVSGLRLLISGSPWVAVDPRLKRRDEELLLRKKFASGFFGTDLAQQLRDQKVDTLIITGCTTSGCVRATAVDALQYGFHAIVPQEAVGDRAELPHVANLFDIDAKYGDVVSSQEVLSYLEQLKEPRKGPAIAPAATKIG